MVEFYYTQTIVILAGFLSGCALGLCMTTKTEGIKRDIPTLSIKPLQRVSLQEGVGTIIHALLVLLVLVMAPILISLGILKALGIFGNHGLGQNLANLYFISWFVGIAATKFGRFLYWRSKP